MRKARITVPATSANLGPGFDTLGLALDLDDTVWVEVDAGLEGVELCEVEGEARSLHPRDNLLCQGYRRWFEGTGTDPPGARFRLESRIPVGKGLGSSAAAIVAGLAAAAFAADTPNPDDRILSLASEMEGHPDNVAAALFGGVTVAFQDGSQAHALQVASDLPLGIAMFIPDEELLTADARCALPASVPLKDAVFDLGRLAYLVAALGQGRWEHLAAAMDDRLHQPYRAHLIPGFHQIIEAALASGAYGAAVSGGGPAIIALGPPSCIEVCVRAMAGAAVDCGSHGAAFVSRVRDRGLEVLAAP